jgi:hypothetical protein
VQGHGDIFSLSFVEDGDFAPPAATPAGPSCLPGGPMLSPEDRSKINRANAQKSTGPKTPEGKQRSAKNSMKDGKHASLLRNFVPPHAAVHCNQDRQRFFRLHERLIQDYQPHNIAEAIAVRKIAEAEWRSLTFDELFTGFWNKELMEKLKAKQQHNPEAAELLCQLHVYVDQANHPAVEQLHNRLKKASERTILANEKRLILLRKHFPTASTAIERRDFDREKRDFYRNNPELHDPGPENEANASGPAEPEGGFQLVEQ